MGRSPMQPEFTKVKVHNEIELCETTDMDIKQQIENILLDNRISYYMRWYKLSIFHRNRDVCVICVNENSLDLAESLVRSLDPDIEDRVRFLWRRSQETYF